MFSSQRKDVAEMKATAPTGQPWIKWVLGLVLLGLIVFPFIVTDPYSQQIVVMALMYGALGAAWNLVGGFLGRVSFGHAVFLGLGAYTTLLLLHHAHLSPWLGIPLGGVVAAVVAFVVGRPTLRLTGHYFAMATIAVLSVAQLLVVNWDWAGGATGVEAPIANSAWLLLFRSKAPYYWIAFALALFTLWATIALVRSKTGFYWRAINGDEAAARSLGVPAERYKMRAFVLSAALTGVWGGFYGVYIGFIDPDSAFNLTLSVQIVLVAILGGVGSIAGPWLGAAVLIPLAEGTRVALGSSGQGMDLLLYGLAIVLVSLFLPSGLITLRLRRGSARS
ncbi:ABC transporter permease [Pandoraea thiooxydans]|uniref:ABC transporter permease n=1 Tax=Pandoraea thiooxydans TaxID=445709 RepID=A0A0G3F0E8_9BURK|nr:ABC transporter permease [Pandoraea thiooxydans]